MTSSDEDEKKKKKTKIIFADSTAIDALAPYVQELLTALSQELDNPYLKDAWVSDKSCIIDFFYKAKFFKRKEDIANNLSKTLGVTIDVNDYVYQVAIRLRDK